MQERGLLRRVAAILYHRRAGFSANGMGVWKVPDERVLDIGRQMALGASGRGGAEVGGQEFGGLGVFAGVGQGAAGFFDGGEMTGGQGEFGLGGIGAEG